MSAKRSSYLWRYFCIVNEGDKIAQCKLCGQVCRFKGTVSNLKKHLMRRHPTVFVDVHYPPESVYVTENLLTQEHVPEHEHSVDIPNSEVIIHFNNAQDEHLKKRPKRSYHDPSINPLKKIDDAEKKRIDNCLLDLFIKDFQPFSIVEEQGFKNFIHALNPAYTLPSKKNISNVLIPEKYEQCLNVVRNLLSTANSVCLTTDTWASQSSESYISVTAHWISDNFELKSVLLKCVLLATSYTSTHIAAVISEIVNHFQLSDKVLAVVTNSNDVMKNAVIDELGWEHVSCLAHALNIVVQDSLKSIEPIIEQIKSVVNYFRRSKPGEEKLKWAQQNLGLPMKKLIQDIPNRWNTTFNMVARLVELKDAVITAIGLTNEDLTGLSEEEWVICEELIVALRPFEQVSKFFSGEPYVAGSQVIVLANSLLSALNKMVQMQFSSEISEVVNNLKSSLKTRMENIESNKTLGLATFLDPRFKIALFTDSTAAQAVRQHCSDLMNLYSSNEDKSGDQETTVPIKREQRESFSVWDDLDQLLASKKPIAGTEASAAIMELNRYLAEEYLHRGQDPLEWWKQNYINYPILAQLTRDKFNILATSIPCDQIFSKVGYEMSERRSRLSSKHVDKIIFLNGNSNIS